MNLKTLLRLSESQVIELLKPYLVKDLTRMVLSPSLKLKAFGKSILICKEEKEEKEEKEVKEEKEEKIGTMKKSTVEATKELTAEVMIEAIGQDMVKKEHAVVSMKAIPSELGGSSL